MRRFLRVVTITLPLLLVTSAAYAQQKSHFITLYNFTNQSDGSVPTRLVQATDGNLYGTALSPYLRYGTIFKITPPGVLTILPTGPISGPGPLIQASDGNLYGTSSGGGYYGSVVKVTLGGTITTLHGFNSAEDGAPVGALVEARDGNLYGATTGTLFRVTPTGVYTLLHIFSGPDGQEPLGSLAEGPDGNLYGVTVVGGANGAGVVFTFNISTGTVATLYDFAFGNGAPQAPLIRGTDGNFYGTTLFGGAYTAGTIYRITPSGTFTTLHNFRGRDGLAPSEALVEGNDRNFYGTTLGSALYGCDGVTGCGTLFTSTPTGTVTSLIVFDPSTTGGAFPMGLTQHTNGRFYGVTLGGILIPVDCAFGCGTIYQFSRDLPAFVEPIPNFASVGARVRILGTKLANTTRVTFNGTPAAFKVVSPTYVKATVPAGATTGSIQVITPDGVLTSNVPFEVIP